MRKIGFTTVFLVFSVPAMAGESFKLPPEVTPQLRAACESDVRRLCVGQNPTVSKVKSCVISKFMKLGMRCKKEIASAGLL
ncbi:MAG: hypothetical protein KDJ37_09865 [Hyphomicrobiaceae bacterium]|nr:hypothetical protein [Hyphomicrobiaceae bacterium]